MGLVAGVVADLIDWVDPVVRATELGAGRKSTASTPSACARRNLWVPKTSSSRRTVPTHRSATAFARGPRTGVRKARMPSEAKIASKLSVNFASRSRTRNLNCLMWSARCMSRLRAGVIQAGERTPSWMSAVDSCSSAAWGTRRRTMRCRCVSPPAHDRLELQAGRRSMLATHARTGMPVSQCNQRDRGGARAGDSAGTTRRTSWRAARAGSDTAPTPLQYLLFGAAT
jgi:hypothetical protein